VSVENIKNLQGSEKFVSESEFERLYKNRPEKGDLLMTRIGSVGDCAVVDFDEPIAFYVSLALVKPDRNKLVSSYLKFYLESARGKAELYKRTLHQAVPVKINLGDVGKVEISLPPLEMQRKIVARLNLFQTVTESLSHGLPGEIEARRKQYVYYRDKLLTFKELVA
jgi:type I restriction enzyme S subunit